MITLILDVIRFERKARDYIRVPETETYAYGIGMRTLSYRTGTPTDRDSRTNPSAYWPAVGVQEIEYDLHS